MTLYEFDCAEEPMKGLAMDAYLSSNLQGDLGNRADDAKAEWFYPRPNMLE